MKQYLTPLFPLLASLSIAIALMACAGPGEPEPSAAESNSSGSSSSRAFTLSRAQFEQLFPDRIPFYTYEGLVAAAVAYPAFANSGDVQRDRQEMAAFLANLMQESDSLRAVREYNKALHDQYCRQGPNESCAPGQQYYGRGPIQLSWNYNYLAAGKALGLDLWGNPELVATNATVAWQTALWYWMSQTGPSLMTPHEAIGRGAGFGATIRAINGVIECDKPNDARAQRHLADRLAYYTRTTRVLDVPMGPNLGC
ncbi:chitinase [Roseateles sp. DAIF2]|uniref:chitinase n=1 Tax=Roseateles sp. DAIF2 TaxID=2714952 RepID=UPI0018A3228A|nr:chitinase [Roseateles sp. DAIF2]QPF75760.1 chitinase [Roseateles sp. DAIF2]